jgi:drug/metabolite transporter (DMT)-like permease
MPMSEAGLSGLHSSDYHTFDRVRCTGEKCPSASSSGSVTGVQGGIGSVRGPLCLMLSVLIFAAQPATFQTVNRSRPRVFDPCTTLCGANIVGAATLIPLNYKAWTAANLRALQRQHWFALLASALLYSLLGPMCYYMALSTSISVPTAAILTQFESLQFLVLSRLFLRERIDLWSLCNAALTFLGILVGTVLAPLWLGLPVLGDDQGFQGGGAGGGDILIILSGLCYSCSMLITKRYLSGIPTGILVVFRVLVGGTLYMTFQILLGENDKQLLPFQDSSFWLTQAWYGTTFVTIGTMAFLAGLQHSSPTALSVQGLAQFVLTLAWSALIQGSVPTTPEWMGSAVIAAGVLSSIARSVGVQRQRGGNTTDMLPAQNENPQLRHTATLDRGRL